MNDDNYVVFNSNVDGSYVVPGPDGYMYLIGETITKVDLQNVSISI